MWGLVCQDASSLVDMKFVDRELELEAAEIEPEANFSRVVLDDEICERGEKRKKIFTRTGENGYRARGRFRRALRYNENIVTPGAGWRLVRRGEEYVGKATPNTSRGGGEAEAGGTE